MASVAAPEERVILPIPTSLGDPRLCSGSRSEAFQKGGRKGAKKVMIVITDGESHDSPDLEKVIQQSERDNVTRYAVAVSPVPAQGCWLPLRGSPRGCFLRSSLSVQAFKRTSPESSLALLKPIHEGGGLGFSFLCQEAPETSRTRK